MIDSVRGCKNYDEFGRNGGITTMCDKSNLFALGLDGPDRRDGYYDMLQKVEVAVSEVANFLYIKRQRGQEY